MASKRSKVESSVPPMIADPWALFLAVAATVRRLMLWGERAGTGKTSAALAMGEAQDCEVYSVTLHLDTTVATLMGHFVNGKGNETVWHDGIVSFAIRRAMAGVKTLLAINELNKGEAVQDLFYNILEADERAGRVTLASGEVLTITENLRIVCTQNPDPADTLPQPIRDRFQVIIPIGEQVSPMVLQAIPETFRSMVADGRMQAREYFSMAKLIGDGCNPYVACQAVLGNERYADYADALAVAFAS